MGQFGIHEGTITVASGTSGSVTVSLNGAVYREVQVEVEFGSTQPASAAVTLKLGGSSVELTLLNTFTKVSSAGTAERQRQPLWLDVDTTSVIEVVPIRGVWGSVTATLASGLVGTVLVRVIGTW